ncbi:MAG: hypothetical protein ACPGVO_00040 [Spirulinaceae cyanobacterium]
MKIHEGAGNPQTSSIHRVTDANGVAQPSAAPASVRFAKETKNPQIYKNAVSHSLLGFSAFDDGLRARKIAQIYSCQEADLDTRASLTLQTIVTTQTSDQQGVTV